MPQSILELMEAEVAPKKSVLELMEEETRNQPPRQQGGYWGKESLKKGFKTGLDYLLGIPEAAANVASGLGAGMIGLVGGASKAAPEAVAAITGQGGKPFQTAKQTMGEISEVGTYKPKTEFGKTVSEVANAPLSAANVGVSKLAQTITKDPEAQAAIEVGGSLLVNALMFKYGARIAKGEPITKSSMMVEAKKIPDLPKEIWDVLSKTDEQMLNDWLRESSATSARKPGELKNFTEIDRELVPQKAEASPTPPIKNRGIVPLSGEEALNQVKSINPELGEKVSGLPIFTKDRGGFINIGKEPTEPPLPPSAEVVESHISRPKSTVEKAVDSGRELITDPIGHIKNAKDVFMREGIDRLYDIAVAERGVEKETGQPIPLHESSYYKARNKAGSVQKAEAVAYELRDVIAPIAKYRKNWENYVVSTRMVERAVQKVKNPGDVTADLGAQIGSDILNNVGPEIAKKFRSTARKLYALTDYHVLGRMERSGMINHDQHVAIKEKNVNHIPFSREMVKEPGKKVGGLGELPDPLADLDALENGSDFVSIVNNELYPKVGMAAGTKIKDPIRAITERIVRTIDAVDRNDIVKSFVDNMQRGEESKKATYKLKPGQQIPRGATATTVIRDGKVEKWVIPEDIGWVLKNMRSSDIGLINKFLGNTKGMFTAATTGWYLPFAISTNPLRDTRMALSLSKYNFNPLSLMRGLGNALSSEFGFPTNLYKAYLQSGAGGGQLLSSLKKMPDLWKLSSKEKSVLSVFNPVRAVPKLGRAIETAPRLAVFDETVQGVMRANPEMPLLDATTIASLFSRGTTVDFYRAGRTARAINQVIPFFNARLQSTVTTMEALFSNQGIRSGKSSGFGLHNVNGRLMTGMKIGAYVILPNLASYLYRKLSVPELDAKISQDDKDRFIILPINQSKDQDTGRMKVNSIILPKTEPDQIIWNSVERILDAMWDKKPLEMKKFALNFFSNFSPVTFDKDDEFNLSRAIAGVTPPSVQALVGPAVNKNLYFDKPIVPEALEKVSPPEQYTKYTPEMFKKLGKKLNMSPMKLQYFVQQGLGRAFTVPEPTSLAKEIGRTVYRPLGFQEGVEERKVNDESVEGYMTARIKAKRLLATKDIKGAIDQLKVWNMRMDDVAAQMARAGKKTIKEMKASSWYKANTFQTADFKRLMTQVLEEESNAPRGLEKSLNTRAKK